ncbi:DUF2513 domain-containing protein [Selenomonas sp. AE3005]|uniref:DUF2513 domain-containing protein n=1 Tax=Selenomonas sp. AE3005 TaxID=1485543 RepID=UPI0025CE4034|nr:DUF2513 domain-containing protein [Selenomonas sp. AE3005]
MKRDMDLCRKILLTVEKMHIDSPIVTLRIEGYDTSTIAYHCQILYDAGLLLSYKPVLGGDTVQYFFVGGLTWKGNDYLDKIRDKSIWENIKRTIKDRALPFTIDVVKEIATNLTDEKLGQLLHS